MNDYVKRWYPIPLALIAAACSLAVIDRLPDPMVVHWDLAGNPNGWMPRSVGAFITPVIMLVPWLMLRVVPRLDPRRANYQKFTGAYDRSAAAMLGLVFVLHLVLLAAALGYRVPIARIAAALGGVLFLVVGDVIPRVRSNFMFVIRTPWTLSSDRVWARTHRLAGYTMTAAGGVMMLSARFASTEILGAVVMTAVIAALVAPAVYSYLTFRRETSA